MKSLILGSSLFFLFAAAACSGTSDASPNGAATGTSPTLSTTAVACLVTFDGFEPECQLYEATGADAPRTISQLRAECIDSSGLKAHVVDACPKAGSLGGCKSEVAVKGATDVKLFVTNFEYQPTATEKNRLDHTTPAQVESFCKVQDGALFIASP